MKVHIDSPLYNKRFYSDIRDLMKNKFKVKKPIITTPRYTDKGTKKK